MIGLWYVIRKVLDRMNAMVMGMLRQDDPWLEESEVSPSL
jgi:hypothetical protein